MMRLVYLPVNAAWCFLFGDSPLKLHNADSIFYTDRDDAVADAVACRMTVLTSGRVVSLPGVEEVPGTVAADGRPELRETG